MTARRKPLKLTEEEISEVHCALYNRIEFCEREAKECLELAEHYAKEGRAEKEACMRECANNWHQRLAALRPAERKFLDWRAGV